MSNQRTLQWVKEGYYMVSQNGIDSINIESIARKINKNKSSFYHYFGDLEIFEKELLEFHQHQFEQFADHAIHCDKIKPDLLNLFIDFKIDLFFHKQLRINRGNPEYKKCYEKAYEKLEEAIIDKWADFLELNQQKLFAQTFLRLITENFLLQITEQTFNYSWLNNYLDEVNAVLKQMSIKPKK